MKWHILALIVGGLVLRMAWCFTPAGITDGDEAVFGLMALHILEGRDYPLYCWGAHYSGALVSYLAAVGFWLFGIGGVILKSVSLPFAAGYLAATYGLALASLDDRTARIALLLAALPPAIPLAFSVKARGGYVETLCLGGLLLLLAFRLPKSASRPRRLPAHLALLGFTAGFGLYILPLILPYMAVAFFFLLLRRRQALGRHGWGWLLAGILAGASPMLAYNFMYPMATLLRLGSRVLDVSRTEALDPHAGLSTAVGWMIRYVRELPGGLLTLLQNLGLLLGMEGISGAVIAGALTVAAILALCRRGKADGQPPSEESFGRWCALLVPAVLLFAWLTGLNRSRHLVPLYSVLPLGLASLYHLLRRYHLWTGRLALAAVLLAGAWDVIESARIPSGVPMAPLVRATEQGGIRGVYADYEIAYRLMFASREAVLASPTAWPAGVISDRMPEVTRQVDLLPSPAYVFRGETPEASWFAQGLARRDIRFTRHAVGPFDLFTDLSSPVRSAAMPVTRGW